MNGLGQDAAPGAHELVVHDLRAGVTGRTVLDGIELRVRSGEVHALMGPNGSGKSTFAHVLMGRAGYEVLSGTVTLDGHDLLALPAWRRARLGLFVAPQYPTEVPGVALSDVLAEAEAALGASVGSERVAATLAEAQRIGLDPRLIERPVNVDLSGGERKRSETLQLAMLRPPIAVLDELDSGLDVDGLRDIARRVRDGVQEWGLGVLAITHYRRLLVALRPDAVHVLVHGRIVASGGPELADELERHGYAPFGGGGAMPEAPPALEPPVA